jgi:hypothetical protein
MDSVEASGGCGPGGGAGCSTGRLGGGTPLRGADCGAVRGIGTAPGSVVRAPPNPVTGAGRTRRRGFVPTFCSCSSAWISSVLVVIAPCSRFIRSWRLSTMSRLRNCMLVITLLSEVISCATLRPHSGHPLTVSARAPQFEQGYDPTAALLSGLSRRACRVTASYG